MSEINQLITILNNLTNIKFIFTFEYKCMYLFSKTKCIFKYKCMHVNRLMGGDMVVMHGVEDIAIIKNLYTVTQ